jgi:hypothetical protein
MPLARTVRKEGTQDGPKEAGHAAPVRQTPTRLRGADLIRCAPATPDQRGRMEARAKCVGQESTRC